MKKIMLAFFALLPLTGMAQYVWETQQPSTDGEKQQRALFEPGKTNKRDPKYLVNAIPVVDGKVVFTADIEAKGKTAQQVYDIVAAELEKMSKESNQFKESQVAVINAQEKKIGGRFREWLVFQKSALALDATIFNYSIICDCSDGHLHMTISRISYEYETDRTDTGIGQEMTAEQCITDEYGLTRNKQKLSRYYGKFRKKTIDRKDYIFAAFAAALAK